MIRKFFDKTRGVNVGGRRIECIRVADNMAVLAEKEEAMNEMIRDLNLVCEEYGMRINKEKTKCMVCLLYTSRCV